MNTYGGTYKHEYNNNDEHLKFIAEVEEPFQESVINRKVQQRKTEGVVTTAEQNLGSSSTVLKTATYPTSNDSETNLRVHSFSAKYYYGSNIFWFSALHLMFGRILNPKAELFSSLSFMNRNIILVVTDLAMVTFLISLGFLGLTLFHAKRASVRRFLYVALSEEAAAKVELKLQIIVGFMIALFLLPIWLSGRDYTYESFPLGTCYSVLQSLLEIVCCADDGIQTSQLPLCHILMICLPLILLTAIPGVTSFLLYKKYVKHVPSIDCAVQLTPEPTPIYSFPPKNGPN